MPPGGRLPDLNGKQTRALLNHFARHWHSDDIRSAMTSDVDL